MGENDALIFQIPCYVGGLEKQRQKIIENKYVIEMEKCDLKSYCKHDWIFVHILKAGEFVFIV